MEGFVDLYARLIISVLSFMAPLIVYLLSVFSDGVAIIKRRSKEETNQIGELLLSQINVNFPDGFDLKVVDQSNKALKRTKKMNAVRLNLLDPKRQIYRIFSTLFMSLFCIMLYKTCDPFTWMGYTLVASSLICFVVGLLILKQVTWAVINIKEIISQDKSAVTVGS